MCHAAYHLQCQDNVVADGKLGNNPVALAVLRQIADAVFHGVKRLCDFHALSAHLHASAGDRVGTEDGTHTFASARAEKTGKAVDLAFGDMEVKRPAFGA